MSRTLVAVVFLALLFGCGRDRTTPEPAPPPEPPAPDSFVVAPPGPPDTIIKPNPPRRPHRPK